MPRASAADVPAAQSVDDALIVPAALAGDAAGNVYVADVAAQRISRVARDGRVETVAGANPFAPGHRYALGSFADGPATVARFRHPGSLALAHDGTLYVADTYNHCIRRIAAGRVTTYAGNANESAVVDGALASARFLYPRALAFDAAGNLYVADFTVGIRKISADGVVSTLHLPGVGADVTALSLFEDGAGETLFASDDVRTVAVDLTTMHADVWSDRPPAADTAVRYRPLEGDREPGRMSAIVALGHDRFAYADARSGEVKLIVRDALGVVSRAALGSPLGIALAGRSLAVSDSQHHRIVRYPLPDLRSYSLSVPPRKAPGTYRIAIMSDSFAFYDTLWSDSIPGVLEARLRLDASAPDLKRAETIAVRQSSIDALRSYVDEDIASGQVDAIVLLVNSPFIYEPIYGGKDWGSNLAASPERWRAQTIASLEGFARAVAAKSIPLFVVVHPLAIELSPLENLDAREAQSGGISSEDGTASYAALVGAVRSAHLPNVADLGPAMLDEESQPAHPALYGSYDFHFSAAGRAFAAARLAELIEGDARRRAFAAGASAARRSSSPSDDASRRARRS